MPYASQGRCFLSQQPTIYSVLIVEDDPSFIRERLATAVSQHPQRAVGAEAGFFEDASALLASEQPAVLPTDLGLPDGDGMELIR